MFFFPLDFSFGIFVVRLTIFLEFILFSVFILIFKVDNILNVIFIF